MSSRNYQANYTQSYGGYVSNYDKKSISIKEQNIQNRQNDSQYNLKKQNYKNVTQDDSQREINYNLGSERSLGQHKQDQYNYNDYSFRSNKRNENNDFGNQKQSNNYSSNSLQVSDKNYFNDASNQTSLMPSIDNLYEGYSKKSKIKSDKKNQQYYQQYGSSPKNNNGYEDYNQKSYNSPKNNKGNSNYDSYGFTFDKKQSNRGNKNNYDIDYDNSINRSSNQSSQRDLFENQNGYDVSDGQSDDCLDISDLEDENELRNKRYQSKQRFEKREQVQEWEIEYAFKKFRANMKQIMAKKQINLRTIFRQLDTDNDNFISYIDFCRGLSQININSHIYFNLDDFDLVTCLFERLDIEKQKKISFDAFRQVIYKSKEDKLQISNLLKKIRLKFNQKDKDKLNQLFSEFDLNKDGKIQFNEFKQIMLKFELQQKEIDELFIHFDKLKQNEIGYEEFTKVLFEDHMIQSNISKTIQEYMGEKSMSLRHLYDSFSDPQTKELKIGQYIKMMKHIGFKYSDQIVEETFDFFDADKSGSISYEEFEKVIYEQDSSQNENTKSRIPVILRAIRRQTLSRGIDICLKLKSVNHKSRNRLNFSIFCECLRELNVDIKQFEKEVLFNLYKRVDEQDYLDVEKIVDDILFQKFDVSFIRQRLLANLKRYNLTYGQLFSFFDENQNETINYQEFCQLLDVIQVRLTAEESIEAFATFDINQDGDVTQDEFIRVLEGKEVDHQIRFEQMMNNLKVQQQAEQPKNLMQLLEHKGIKVEGLQIKDMMSQSEDQQVNKKQIPKNSIFFKNNQNSLNGKIQQHQFSEMYLKFIKEKPGVLKEEFDLNQIIDCIIYNIQELNIDFIHEFIRVDVQHYCVLTSVTDFQNILQNINIFFTKEIIEQVYLLFMNSKNQFEYIKFIMNIYNPFYIFKRIFIYQMQINDFDLTDIIQSIKQLSKDKKQTDSYEEKLQITPVDFVDFCLQTYLSFDKNSFQYIWTRLNPKENEYIGVEEFALGLQIPYNYHPFVDLQNMAEHQVEVINEFCYQMARNSYERNINVIELFLYFDKDCTFKLHNPSILQKLANILQIRMSNLEIKAIYTYLSKGDDCGNMPYFDIIKKTQLPHIYLKSILVIFLRMESWTLKQLFDHFQKENYWDLEILRQVIGYAKIKGISKDIERTFQVWANNKDRMNLNDLARVLNIQENWSHKEIELDFLNKQNMNIKDHIHLIDVVPSSNPNYYLYYYINEPTTEFLQNQKKILQQGEEYAIQQRQKELRGGILSAEEEQSIAQAASFLTQATSKKGSSENFPINRSRQSTLQSPKLRSSFISNQQNLLKKDSVLSKFNK
ncbi:hypothetical protein ABPG74_007353 [Tetrahymena malaccensis]